MGAGTRLSQWVAQELQPSAMLSEGGSAGRTRRPTAEAKVAASLGQVTVRVFGDRGEQLREAVIGQIGVGDEDRVVAPVRARSTAMAAFRAAASCIRPLRRSRRSRSAGRVAAPRSTAACSKRLCRSATGCLKARRRGIGGAVHRLGAHHIAGLAHGPTVGVAAVVDDHSDQQHGCQRATHRRLDGEPQQVHLLAVAVLPMKTAASATSTIGAQNCAAKRVSALPRVIRRRTYRDS